MKGWRRGLSLVAASALLVTAMPIDGLVLKANAATVYNTVRIKPTEKSIFNDTNEDGLGEFEGWGTSLCWWANRIGYDETLTNQAANLFYGEDGLQMNIARYNVGGGDLTGTATRVPVNEKAVFYGLEGDNAPTYAGSNMTPGTNSNLSNATYTYSDADFGFNKGDKVGNFTAIGWINKLGDTPGSGDNLHYTVTAPETGKYTVKLVLTLSGNNTRDVALRVAEGTDAQRDYIVDADTINANKIAAGNNNMLFVVTIPEVDLVQGDNQINIAGKNDWTLDFVKMAVIKSGDEGVLSDDSFLHSEHIIRSDSAVPGYAVDVTKIDTNKHDMTWYNEHYTRVDAECGYAWNYNWAADKNQINVLKAAARASGSDFLAEAFSNSPPYFMTVSGCSSGNVDANKDNLRADSVNAFAKYMADIIEHWNAEGVVNFSSATAMNEPYTNYWGANSNKQEGCHFDQGTSQSRIIVALNKELKEKGINLVISASDETSIDTAISSYKALSSEAKDIVTRIDTHTYSGSKRAELRQLAESVNQNLWMSEVDGAFVEGTHAGEMAAALGFAERIMTDVNGLGSSAWILWNAIDNHADNSAEGQKWIAKGSENDFATIDDIYAAIPLDDELEGYWGLAFADHNNKRIETTMKYYSFGQFSRYIRPGMTIVGSDNSNTLVAYDSLNHKVVVVAINTLDEDKTWKFDLSGFASMGSDITAIRTSGSRADGEKWADVSDACDINVDTSKKNFTSTLKANSITTYIIEGVNGIGESVEEDVPMQIKQIHVNPDQVTGSAPWNNDQTHGPAQVVDNDYNTFFDGLGEGYVLIDLKEKKDIAAVGYSPRKGYADRCNGAMVYGSNDKEEWIPLFTIGSVPPENKDTLVYYTRYNNDEREYRYIKYAVSKNGNCNISELKLYEPENDAEAFEAAYEALDIPNKDDVRGNITLPEKIGHDISVTWKTSNTDIVSVTKKTNTNYDDTPAGIVTRPAKDSKVTMTATVSKGAMTKSKTFELTVKAAPKAIKESDYTDYFFSYFAGEGYSDGEQIYFASSEDGLNWSDLNNNKVQFTRDYTG